MHSGFLLNSVLLLLAICHSTSGFPRGGKEYHSSDVPHAKDPSGEPSCEELKAMWRFSKRQSRAAEITNEIPTYRDPFSYNLWEPPYYARSRSIGGMRIGNRYRGRPIYGRVVHKAPMLRFQDLSQDNSRVYEEVARMVGGVSPVEEPRRRVTAFRLSGGGSSIGWTPQSGSFQHLKELIRTERARELQEQRIAEEAAARSATLKELSGSAQRGQSSLRDLAYNYDMDGRDMREEESLVGRGGVLAFPDILAPAANMDEQSYMADHGYFKDRPKTHSSSLFDSSSFNTDLDGFLF